MKNGGRKPLSDLELDLLRTLAESDGLTVREMADRFGQEHGYARTTVFTLLERLRKKEYVTREARDGGFVYTSALSQSELMRSVVGKFVRRALGGSVSPLVSYLVEQGELSDEELRRLQGLVEQLKEKRDDV